MVTTDEEGIAPPSAYTLSLLTARRPSFAGPSGPLSSFQVPETSIDNTQDEGVRSPVSFDDSPIGKPDFSRGIRIKMQGWAGDGVGKVSIKLQL